MNDRIAIITIGSELVSGDGLDTNSAWLSERLTRVGREVALHASCPDEVEAILSLLREAARQAGVIIVTGGLGPTSDDLSRAAIARFINAPIELHQPSLEHIAALFARFKRPMPASNRQQAELPRGVRVLTSWVGTAPGFVAEGWGEGGRGLLYALPGVPKEVYWFWDEYLRQELAKPGQRLAERTFRAVGISESALGERLAELEAEEGLELRYAAEGTPGTIRVTLLTAADEDRAQDLWLRARALVGEKHLCATGSDSLAEAVASLLLAGGLQVATAESCTGGRVAGALTGIPGISRVFNEGVITYSNESKTRYLGVPAELLEREGAVCAEVAVAMARGIRQRAQADLGLGVTGIAGPGGGSEDKPVGLVHLAVVGPGDDDLLQLERRYPGDRQLIQARAAAGALDLIRRAINPSASA